MLLPLSRAVMAGGQCTHDYHHINAPMRVVILFALLFACAGATRLQGASSPVLSGLLHLGRDGF